MLAASLASRICTPLTSCSTRRQRQRPCTAGIFQNSPSVWKEQQRRTPRATRGRVCGKTHDPARPTGSPAFGHAPRSGSPPESASSGHLACDRCATSGSPGKGLLCSTARLESHSPQERRRIRAATRRRCKARHTPKRTQQETPTFCGVLQSPYGSFIELLVRHENVRQNVRVDRGNYRPRTSSMNLSAGVETTMLGGG